MPKYQRPVAVIDAETDPFKPGRIPRPFIWGLYDAGYSDADTPYRCFDNARDLADFLRDKEYIVYAHNGGRFDYHYLLDFIDPFCDIKIINGRLAQFFIGICEFRDSFNIIPIPLEAYRKTKIDYRIFEKPERDKPENRKKIEDYLKDDCIYLYELVIRFIANYGVHLTQAGASMSQWRKISKLKTPKSDSDYYHTFSPYYYGGRCECFHVGKISAPFRSVDINSAYPFAMLAKHPYYVEYLHVCGDPGFMDDEKIGPSFYKVRAVSRGAFPYREPDGSLWFPRDNVERVYHITGWELMAAIDTGTLEQWDVLECLYFLEHVSFEKYVHHFYGIRKQAKIQGDKAQDIFGKLFMNSLSGKFGMCPDRYYDYSLIPRALVGYLHPDNRSTVLDVGGVPYEFAGLLGPWIIARKHLKEDAKRFYNLATIASITGYVRAYLWRAINKCNGLIYCDTDSIVAHNVGDLDFGPELGQWEIEGEFSRGAVGGKKLYAFKYSPGKKGWKIASKGAKLTSQQVMQVADGVKVNYKPKVPTYSVYQKPKFVNRKIKATGKTADMKSKEVRIRPKTVD